MRLCPLAALFTLLLALAFALPAAAQVSDVTREGFTVDFTTQIAGPPAAVWESLVQVGSWWHPDHTFWGDGSAMQIDARPGGCFCEAGPDGAGAVHLMVLNVQPGEWLRMGGALGPLQEYALSGSMTIRLSQSEVGTAVQLVYHVGGHVAGGLEGWADPVAGVLVEAIGRLRSLVETGSPDPGS